MSRALGHFRTYTFDSGFSTSLVLEYNVRLKSEYKIPYLVIDVCTILPCISMLVESLSVQKHRSFVECISHDQHIPEELSHSRSRSGYR